MTRIMLVDDHQIIRDGIRQLLDDEEDIQIIAEAGNVVQALKLLDKQQPDVLITDLSMPNQNGFDLLKETLLRYPKVNTIILSMHIEEAYINQAINIGVKGYLSKDCSRQELIEAIHLASQGETYFSTQVTNALMKSMYRRARGEQHDAQAPLERLTQREREIVDLIMEGLSSPQIADKLFISARTVENHRSNIMSKLDIKNTIELVKLVIESKHMYPNGMH